MSIWKTTLAGVALSVTFGAAAIAQTEITIGVPPVPEFSLPMIAIEKGYFEENGISAKIQLTQGGTAAALQSGSLHIGAVGSPGLIQATDSGLDLVVVAGGAVASVEDTNFGIVSGVGSGINSPADFVGKKVGVPAIGDFFHIMSREWFRVNGVDWHDITFVEGGFPRLPDLLRAGTVDAVVTTQPFMTAAQAPEVGDKTFYIAADLPDRLPPFVYIATREWAEENPETVAAFKTSLDKALVFEEADMKGALEVFSHFVNMPEEILSKLTISKLDTNVGPDQIKLWVDMMEKQDMLRNFKPTEELFLTAN